MMLVCLIIFWGGPILSGLSEINRSLPSSPQISETNHQLSFPTSTNIPLLVPPKTIQPIPTQPINPTPTLSPFIIWSQNRNDVSPEILNAITDLILTSPPAESTTSIYGIVDVNQNNNVWNISIVNVTDTIPPYDDWNIERNIDWAGAVVCIQNGYWACNYFVP